MKEYTVVCKENWGSGVKEKLEDLGINIISINEDVIKVEIPEERFEVLAEIPGIMSIEVANIFAMWK